ncbi:hypothetical protein M8J75_008600 [Diaphorina citri]|nr:hypothetical protein M8J75_008600 [Diaphorina citri]
MPDLHPQYLSIRNIGIINLCQPILYLDWCNPSPQSFAKYDSTPCERSFCYRGSRLKQFFTSLSIQVSRRLQTAGAPKRLRTRSSGI